MLRIRKRMALFLLSAAALAVLSACSSAGEAQEAASEAESVPAESASETEAPADGRAAMEETDALPVSDQAYIEAALDLAQNGEQSWTYSAADDAWTLSVTASVVYPEIADQQGVSVCVPGAYVKGIDTDGDGEEDVEADVGSGAVSGSLVIDYEAEVVSTHGQAYTAATAPVIINTGAAGYGSSMNTAAAATYAAEGYINVSCGNRGKQDTAADAEGNTYYTGDAPSCLVDQKNAVRFVKYNILLGNLPGSIDRFVSTGGSGGGAHAVMLAATSNHEDFYDYQIEAGAVGVYRLADGSYSTAVTVDGGEVEISDGVWGCIAYSPITPLYEADMAMAFEYNLDADYEFSTPFQTRLAEYLSASYMDYINAQELSVQEAQVGFDLDGDGVLTGTVALTIECDPDEYPETNGYHGTYLDLYLAEFEQNLEWYLENLDYAEGWTWFDETGTALSDEAAAELTGAQKAQAFLAGLYDKGSSDGMGMPGGMMGGMPDGLGELPDELDGLPDGLDGLPDGPDGRQGGALPEMDGGQGGRGGQPENGERRGGMGQSPESPDRTAQAGKGEAFDMAQGGPQDQQRGGERSFANAGVAENSAGDTMDVGTPDAGTTQAAGSAVDSANYASFEEMLAAYETDIAAVEAGDQYGKNQVSLYNPLNYTGDAGTEDPVWVRMLLGAAEGDISMFNSLNLQIAMLNAGVDAHLEWQWDGHHVPSEILGSSFALWVDQMTESHADGLPTAAAEPEPLSANGDAAEPGGTDLTGWVTVSDDGAVSFSLAAAAAYRTAGASKAVPGFDVIDYGQEDYVFGTRDTDARHWDSFVLEVLQQHAQELAELFTAGN